ncbi:hypothetical protein T484DRAFT_1853281, partial [Baffinella frigidus]
DGQTALQYAVTGEKKPVAVALWEAGARFDEATQEAGARFDEASQGAPAPKK